MAMMKKMKVHRIRRDFPYSPSCTPGTSLTVLQLCPDCLLIKRQMPLDSLARSALEDLAPCVRDRRVQASFRKRPLV